MDFARLACSIASGKEEMSAEPQSVGGPQTDARAWPPEGLAQRLIHHAQALARRACPRCAEPDDLAQEAVADLVCRVREGFCAHDPFAWLTVAVRTRLVDRLRAHRTKERLLGPYSRLLRQAQCRCAGDGWQDFEELLRAIRPPLREPDKDVLRGLAAGETRRAMAAAAGERVAAVEARTQRALGRVRSFIELHGGRGPLTLRAASRAFEVAHVP
jgi:DNA-directed RNA polymerase specialized sigma24 family protein